MPTYGLLVLHRLSLHTKEMDGKLSRGTMSIWENTAVMGSTVELGCGDSQGELLEAKDSIFCIHHLWFTIQHDWFRNKTKCWALEVNELHGYAWPKAISSDLKWETMTYHHCCIWVWWLTPQSRPPIHTVLPPLLGENKRDAEKGCRDLTVFPISSTRQLNIKQRRKEEVVTEILWTLGYSLLPFSTNMR